MQEILEHLSPCVSSLLAPQSSTLHLGVLYAPLAVLPSPLNIPIFGTYW